MWDALIKIELVTLSWNCATDFKEWHSCRFDAVDYGVLVDEDADIKIDESDVLLLKRKQNKKSVLPKNK